MGFWPRCGLAPGITERQHATEPEQGGACNAWVPEFRGEETGCAAWFGSLF